jgi:hypothetical protein
MNKSEVYVGHGGFSPKLTPIQMQAVAQRNGLDSHQDDGYQDMAGLTVTLADLWTGDTSGRHGYSLFFNQLMELAARVGAVIQHPGSLVQGKAPGEWSPESYFTYPVRREITPHKGGRTVKKSTDVTPEVASMIVKLSEQGVSLGDIVEAAVRSRFAD